MKLVEPFNEEQVGELLNHLHGVGDTTRPHGVPNGIDFRFKFSGNHERVSLVFKG
jgi:hypothetical protein